MSTEWNEKVLDRIKTRNLEDLPDDGLVNFLNKQLFGEVKHHGGIPFPLDETDIRVMFLKRAFKIANERGLVKSYLSEMVGRDELMGMTDLDLVFTYFESVNLKEPTRELAVGIFRIEMKRRGLFGRVT